MNDRTAELDALRPFCDSVELISEGGISYVLLRGMKAHTGSVEQKVDALLCLQAVQWSYPTKLLVSERIGAQPTKLNWNLQPFILGRTWQTFSWDGVPATLSFIEILAAHLEATRR